MDSQISNLINRHYITCLFNGIEQFHKKSGIQVKIVHLDLFFCSCTSFRYKDDGRVCDMLVVEKEHYRDIGFPMASASSEIYASATKMDSKCEMLI